MSEEAILFKGGRVTITPTRFKVGKETFAMRSIVSFARREQKPGCVGALFGKKPTYFLVLTTAAGEVPAFRSQNRDFFLKVVKGLEAAIAHGGE